MTSGSLLKDKIVLVVDDEKDVLDAVAEMLEMCTVYKVSDYETAIQHLLIYTYDIVVLDIMGVKSPPGRHSREGGSPEEHKKTGFPPPRE